MMSGVSIYDRDLDRAVANHAPLSPLSPLASMHLQVRGSPAAKGCENPSSRCMDSSEVTPDTRLRCCDTNTADTCANLNVGSTQDAICGTAVNDGNDVVPITLDPVNGGVDDMDLAAAADECAAQGARLCTRSELEGGSCCGTGCGADSRYIWTSSECLMPPPPSPPPRPRSEERRVGKESRSRWSPNH